MGGKKQDRSKNNAQPSSSERHARQLGSSQLVGFSALSDLGYVPAAVAGVGDEGAVSGQMRAVLKKMAKRDAITRAKAVQEYADMCDSHDLEEVKATLPFWPRLYRKLATDVDNRVREMSHMALQRLLSKVRKAATPHMTELLPVWVCAFSDPYPPAASAARRAFQTVFPSAEKRAAAVRFSYSSIMAHISQGLYDLTAQTYSDASMMSADELEARYVRLLTGCLWGLHELLNLLPSSANADAASAPDPQPLSDLVNNARFCKLAKHAKPEVRRAWCCLVTRLCERRAPLVAAAAGRLAPAAAFTLAETDPAALTDSWNMFVCLVTALPEAWSCVNVRKAVLPQLWPVLREAGRGCAATLHPLLIVLLAALPDAVAGGDQPEFHRLWLSNMRQGLSAERVQQSGRELSVIARSLLECAIYVLKRGCSEPVIELIVQQLCSLTSELVAGSLRRASPHVLPALSAGLNSLHALSGTCAPAAAAQTRYWRSVEQSLLRTHLPDSTADHAASVVELLLSCGTTSTGSAGTDAPRPRVTFSGSCAVAAAPAARPSASALATAADSPLLETAGRAAQYLLDRAAAGAATPTQTAQLARLLAGLRGVAARLGSGGVLYRTLIVPDMRTGAGALASQLTGVVYRLCSQQERAELTEDVMQNAYLPMVVELLRLSSSADSDDYLTRWTASDNLQSLLLASLRDASSSGGHHWKLTVQAIELALRSLEGQEGAGDWGSALLSAAAERRWPLQELAAVLAPHCCSGPALLAAHDVGLRSGGSTAALTALQQRLADLDPATDGQVADQLRQIFCEATSGTQRARLAAVTLAWYRVVGSCRFCRQVSALLPDRWLSSLPRHAAQTCLLLRSGNSLRPLPDNEAETAVDCQAVALYLRTILVNMMQPKCDNQIEGEEVPNSTARSLHQSEVEDLPPDGTHIQPSENEKNCANDEVVQSEGTSEVVEDTKSEITAIRIDSMDKNSSNFGSLSKSLQSSADPSPSKEAHLGPRRVLSAEVSAAVAHYLPHLLTCQAAQTAAGQLMMTSAQSADARAERQLSQLVTSLVAEQRAALMKEMLTRTERGADGVDGAALSLLLRLTARGVSDLPAPLPDCTAPTKTDADVLLSLSSHLSDAALASLVSPPDVAWHRLSLTAAALNHLAARRGTDHLLADCGAALVATLDSLVRARDAGLLPSTTWEEATADWAALADTLSVLHFYSAALEQCWCLIESTHWDLIMLSLSSWIAGLEDLAGDAVRLVTVQSCVALHALGGAVCAVHRAVERCAATNSQLAAEWTDLFRPEWFRVLVKTYATLATCDTSLSVAGTARPSAPLYTETLSSVCSAVVLTPASALTQHALPPLVDADLEQSHLAADVVTLVSWWRRLLTAPQRCVRLAAWQTMLCYLPHLADAEAAKSPEGEDRDEPWLPLPAIFSVITRQTEPLVAALLSDAAPGRSVTVDATCHETVQVVSTHLLTWHLAVSYTAHLDNARKAMTAEALRRDGSVERLLDQLLALMPDAPDQVPAAYCRTTLSYFQLPARPDLRAAAPAAAAAAEVHHWACLTYCQLLRQLPVLARSWRAAAERAAAQRAERLTRQHVSPLLLADEFDKLRAARAGDQNMTVRARPAAREVCAVYTLEEASTELVVRLPADYPLGAVTADAEGRRVGVTAGQWRTWMLQLVTFLMHQNGSVLDGLLVWRQNMDRRFQGAEECNICFYVLHGANYQLPRLACRNCRKRFHPACLYKWFNTSSKSTCPMCRQLF